MLKSKPILIARSVFTALLFILFSLTETISANIRDSSQDYDNSKVIQQSTRQRHHRTMTPSPTLELTPSLMPSPTLELTPSLMPSPTLEATPSLMPSPTPPSIQDEFFFNAPPRIPAAQSPEIVHNEDMPSLPLDLLPYINSPSTAVSAVNYAIRAVDLDDPLDVEALTLFSEEAIAMATSRQMVGSSVSINRLTTVLMDREAERSKSAVELALSEASVPMSRELRSTLVFQSDESDELRVAIDRTASLVEADRIRIDMPEYSLTISDTFAYRNASMTIDAVSNDESVEITFSHTPRSAVVLSMPNTGYYETVFNHRDENLGGQINNISGTLNVRVNTNGVYRVQQNRPEFSDLDGLTPSRRRAIISLASRGIISGYSETQFGPNDRINRAQVAMLVTKASGYYCEFADGSFIDVFPADWFFNAAGSARNHGIMHGTNVQGTVFSPAMNIPRVQMVSIVARVLRREMRLQEVANVDRVLSPYGDRAAIPDWAENDVALVKRLGLLDSRSRFEPRYELSRGEVAEILFLMYDKIWLN